MSRKTNEFLNEKLQVKLPRNLSKENIINKIDTPQAEIIEMPKKKNVAKKIIPMVASLLLVVGLVGMYFGMGLGDKNAPVQNENAEVVQYQSYDKIYEKFDKLHKESKKHNLFNGYFGVTNEEIAVDDGADMMADGSSMPESAPENMNGAATGTNSDKIYGTTNTQEKDVDEGDIIKTDGNYLYIANVSDEAISIIDVTGEKMTEVSQLDVSEDEIIKELYLNGNTMVVVGNLRKEEQTTQNSGLFGAMEDVAYFYTSDTFVKVYDITDRKAPELINEYSQEGNYENSRMIGTKLYVISTYFVNVYVDDYRDRCIPEVTVNGVCEQLPCDCISIIEESDAPTYAVITTLDISEKKEPESTAILGNCENLYASSKGLFLCETVYTEESEQTTKIYRFEYTDTGVEFKMAGAVEGYLNNQFSMSYDGEYFRVATTVNKTKVEGNVVSMSANDRVNNLYILNNNMNVVGKVEDMAKGELIKSVRFVGNMAYVVTFRQTDPLFVIDLTNPEKPTVKGELKIPGFSEYLHPIADGLLVGVGQDGTMSGVNGDCKVSLFDVSDPYEPKESSVLRVTDGKGYCHSPVAYNHKVYVTLSEKEFAVPFSINSYVIDEKEMGEYYIRYTLTDNGLSEIARYNLGEVDGIIGATYVEDVFYVVTTHYEKGTCVTAFSLTTNEQLDSVKL